MTDEERARIVTELVEEHSLPLYRFAYRLSGSAADAEDLVQQAFLTAQEKLDQLRDGQKARSWLLTIVRNIYLKGRRKSDFVSFDDLAGAPDPAFTVPASAVDSEDLQTVLNETPDEFRIPLILFYFQNMSYKEIAAHLNVPEGTVMSRLSRAKAFMRRRLTGRMGDDAPLPLMADRSIS